MNSGTEAIAITWRSSGSLIKIRPEPAPPDYYSVFTQKFHLLSSYTLTARSVQTEIHNLHGKCICCCGYLDKHTRLNFYLYEPPKPNICHGINVRSGDDSVALWQSEKLVCFPYVICPAGTWHPKISPFKIIKPSHPPAVLIWSRKLQCCTILKVPWASVNWVLMWAPSLLWGFSGQKSNCNFNLDSLL